MGDGITDSPKLVERGVAAERLAQLRRRGGRSVFTNGCFDLLHYGHARMLYEARALGELLIVAINSDDSVRRLKGSQRPIVNERERANFLALFEFVDLVTIYDEDTPIPLLALLQPEILVKGGDYVPDTVVGRDLVESYGGSVVIGPKIPGLSTSEIIRRIRATT